MRCNGRCADNTDVDHRQGTPVRVVRAALLAALGLASVTLAAAGLAVATLHLHVDPVLSGSMRPAYGPGDLVVTRQVPAGTVRPGSIVLVVPPGESTPFAHRIVTVTGDQSHPTITTKGDANPVPDRWRVTLSSPTVPRVVAVAPKLGAFALINQSPRGKAFAGAGLGLIVSLFGVIQMVAILRRSRVSTVASPAIPAG